MGKSLRFSDYELFAYVATGIAAIAIWDLAIGTHIVVGAQWTLATSSLTIVFAYVIGHILASPASVVLEKCLVRRVLGAPAAILFQERQYGWRSWLQRTIMSEYFTPLESGLRDRVIAKARANGNSAEPGEPLFWDAFAVAKSSSAARFRLETFLKLYGFCRNLSFCALLGAIVLLCAGMWSLVFAGWTDAVQQKLMWSVVLLAVGMAMTARYLKFHRLYAVEVFVTFGGISAVARKRPRT
jgi:hypothetical protein